jgi:hypothetical protein
MKYVCCLLIGIATFERRSELVELLSEIGGGRYAPVEAPRTIELSIRERCARFLEVRTDVAAASNATRSRSL